MNFGVYTLSSIGGGTVIRVLGINLKLLIFISQSINKLHPWAKLGDFRFSIKLSELVLIRILLKKIWKHNLVLHKIGYCYCENHEYLISHNKIARNDARKHIKLIIYLCVIRLCGIDRSRRKGLCLQMTSWWRHL